MPKKVPFRLMPIFQFTISDLNRIPNIINLRYYNIIYYPNSMNPFTQLHQHSTQDDYIIVQNKHKHQKQAKSHSKKNSVINVAASKEANQSVPEKIKESPWAKHHYKKTHPKKGLTDGHYLDRQSGSGRLNEPRKNGGGRGNIGNLNDILKRDIYEKETEQSEQETVKIIEEVPEEEDSQQKKQSFNLNKNDFPSLV